MFDLMGGFRGAMAALVGASAMWAAMSAYDVLDDRSVAREARATQLAQFEAESAKALNRALLIAGKAQRDAMASATQEQLMLNRWHESKSARMEAEIAALETDLASRGRSCLLDRSDIDRVRNAGRKTHSGGK